MKKTHDKARLVLVLLKIAREAFELLVQVLEYLNSANKYAMRSAALPVLL